MKKVPNRQFTAEFRTAAVKQVLEGERGVAEVARSLEMSEKTLWNWVARSRVGQPLLRREPGRPVSDLEAENARLRQVTSG